MRAQAFIKTSYGADRGSGQLIRGAEKTYWIERVPAHSGPPVAVCGHVVIVQRTADAQADFATARAELVAMGLLIQIAHVGILPPSS